MVLLAWRNLDLLGLDQPDQNLRGSGFWWSEEPVSQCWDRDAFLLPELKLGLNWIDPERGIEPTDRTTGPSTPLCPENTSQASPDWLPAVILLKGRSHDGLKLLPRTSRK